MTDIEERFADNGDDGSLIERQLPSRAGVKRESSSRPTKNRFTNLNTIAVLLVLRNNNPRLVSGRIREAQCEGRRLIQLSQRQRGP